MHQKLWLDDVRLLGYGARWTDRRMEKVTYRGGCPPKKINISNTVQFSLGWKKGIVSQIILSKPLNIGQIYTIPKLIKEEIVKKKKKKVQISIWIRYFRHRYSTKLSRISMDLKIIKTHQCFVERSHAVLIELKE